MLFHLFYPLRDIWFGFNVFKYITFRAAMAGVTSFLCSILLGAVIIRWLTVLNFGQYIRRKHVEPLYDLHKEKEGIPTMGGIFIILSIVISTVLWADIFNRYGWPAQALKIILSASPARYCDCGVSIT